MTSPTAPTASTDAAAALRLAEHLTSLVLGGRCELSAFPEDRDRKEAWREDLGRCPGKAVAIKWEDGFADKVCDRHAEGATSRRALVVYPRRHDGTQRAEVSGNEGVSDA